MADITYDAIVVGSGATGGFAAKELAERGLKVLMLEAGPAHDETLFEKQHGKAVSAIDRIKAGMKGQHMQARASWFSPDKDFLFVNDLKNPYVSSGEDFLWVRGRQVGGRFHTWGRVAVRLSDYDFKAASYDGVGEDWPISYADIEKYYDHVESFLGIVGKSENIDILPDGKFEHEAGLSMLEQKMKSSIEAKWPERKLTSWRYVKKESVCSQYDNKRVTAAVAAGLASGNLTMMPDAIVSSIETDNQSGKATGVSYIHRVTKKQCTVSANVVVLCASTIESIRILLNSRSAKHPEGVGNSSGLLGRYFMDQTPAMLFGAVPGKYGWEQVDTFSANENHGGFYIPRFQNLGSTQNEGFVRGFNMQGLAGRMPVPENVPTIFGMTAQGEMLPYATNRITLSKNKKDAWGIPAANIHIAMTENERNMAINQMDTMKEIVQELGWSTEIAASVLGLDNSSPLMPNANWFERTMFRLSYKKSMGLGAAIHECGGARMGTSPQNSVLNAYNQCWDAENIFVTDSSCFVTNTASGPTLTTMALTVRACEYIAKEYSGNADIASAV